MSLTASADYVINFNVPMFVYQMDTVGTQGHTRYGTVSTHGVTLGNIAGNHHEIIGKENFYKWTCSSTSNI